MKKNSKNSPLPNLPSHEEILGLIHKQKRPLRTDSLYRILHVPRQAKRELACMLDALVADGLVVRLPGGLWADAAALKKVTGRFQSAKSGGGTVLPFGAKEGEEIAIPIQHTNDAWPRDIVSVALLPGSHGKQGKVLEIIERGRKEITAKITRREKNVLECRPSDRRLKLTFKVFIENTEPLRDKLKPGLLVSLHPGEKLGPDVWKASLVNIFGAEDKIKVQEALVKSNYQVPTAFPELAKRQADELPPAPLPEEFAGREDLRHLPFVTIDGADARDFDDAVHVEKTPSGWILRVAIADVSHYVAPDKREGSLDAEALRRGNSWYFPSSVEPMLPEALSNGLCSLRPDEDRLAVMVEMPFDFSGNPGKPRFAPIGMRSHARLIYEDVAKFFNGDSGAIPVALRAGMRDAFDLYKVLARKRSERGSLEFELPDPRYTFDSNGRLESMTSAKSDDARLLIEEFMIAANEAVAKFLGEKNLPLLYRCHPAPEETKAEKLLDTLQATALESLPPGLDKDALSNPKTFQTILNKVKGAPSEYVVSRLCLRSMSQARYQPDNVGHFGLASPDYCHFTSPIRRYADLTVHRALKHSLGLPQPIVADFEKLAEIGERLNKTERQALECEREMARRLGCLALKKREGEKFSGVISGVTDFGVFVELNDIPTEGMIRLESLGDDWFELDQRRQALVGQRSGKTWRLGQEVEVLVGDVD
ncbi:MAG: ribonuclease R, partial [Desulfovibrio sp.]|nr:ribonuclease R [Desulfovibrio sp.]